jgi:hypothetical protein
VQVRCRPLSFNVYKLRREEKVTVGQGPVLSDTSLKELARYQPQAHLKMMGLLIDQFRCENDDQSTVS